MCFGFMLSLGKLFDIIQYHHKCLPEILDGKNLGIQREHSCYSAVFSPQDIATLPCVNNKDEGIINSPKKNQGKSIPAASGVLISSLLTSDTKSSRARPLMAYKMQR